MPLDLQIYCGFSSVTDPREQLREKGGGKRGVIKDFSRQARLRLMKKLMSLSQPPRHFITLTYPAVYPADPDEWKRHLDSFFKRLNRLFPDNWFLWKLEPQERGAPHFHLIGDLFGDPSVYMKESEIYGLLRPIWYQVVGATGENGRKHFLKGVQAKNVENGGHKKLSNYTSKYIGKVQLTKDLPEWARPGRFWGINNRKNMPAFQWDNICLDISYAVWIKRMVRRWMKRRSRQYSRRMASQRSYSIFAPPELLRKILFWILGPFQLARWRSDQEFGDVYFYDPKNGLQLDCAGF